MLDKIISVGYALKRIDEYIAIDRKAIRNKNAEQDEIESDKENLIMLEKDTKGIQVEISMVILEK